MPEPWLGLWGIAGAGMGRAALDHGHKLQGEVRSWLGAAGQRAELLSGGVWSLAAIAAAFAVGVYEVTFAQWDACVVHGNAAELVDDCYEGDCTKRVVRGGSWADAPQYLRSAYRGWCPPTLRNDRNGFRVARALDASDASG